MTRTVGQQIRSPFILDPQVAFAHGLRLDAMLRGTAEPRQRGVVRGPHRMFNELDDGRALQAAQRILGAPTGG